MVSLSSGIASITHCVDVCMSVGASVGEDGFFAAGVQSTSSLPWKVGLLDVELLFCAGVRGSRMNGGSGEVVRGRGISRILGLDGLDGIWGVLRG